MRKQFSFDFVIVSYSAPSATTSDVKITSTPNELIFLWSPLDCIQRNGRITGYLVTFEGPGKRQLVNVTGETFRADNLSPSFEYTFRVAAVNAAGVGPFIDPIFTTAQETGMF